jgi:hypothetical protein
MIQFRLCCFGISGGGGRPGFALTRTAVEADNRSRSFGVKKEIPVDVSRSQTRLRLALDYRFSIGHTLVALSAAFFPRFEASKLILTNQARNDRATGGSMKSLRCMTPILTILLVLATAQLAASQQQLVDFKHLATITAGGAGANIIQIGDLNGDGVPDLVVSVTDDGVGVLLGNGNGTFQAPVFYASGGGFPFSVAIADVNNDGIPDILVANEDGSVGVLLGNGDGTFQPVVTYALGTGSAQSIAVSELNGDGNPDLIVAGCCGAGGLGVVSLLFGNGDGTFQPAVALSSGAYGADFVAVADVNGDGVPDLLVSNSCTIGSCGSGSAGAVSVFLGNGDGTFQSPVIYNSGGVWASSVAVGDVNGDGAPDLVVTNAYSGSVGVLLGNGNGTFQDAVSYPSGGINPRPNFVTIADVNGDGNLDLEVANSCQGLHHCGRPGPVSVLLGNGNGTFQSPVDYKPAGAGPNSVAVGDLNGDGRPDMVAANGCGNESCLTFSLAVLLNILKVPTTLSLSSSLNPSQVNQTVTFTAAITSSLPISNGNIVTFFSGATKLGTGTTNNGSATLTTSFSQAKTYNIKAKFAGGGFLKGSSGTLAQVVNAN